MTDIKKRIEQAAAERAKRDSDRHEQAKQRAKDRDESQRRGTLLLGQLYKGLPETTGGTHTRTTQVMSGSSSYEIRTYQFGDEIEITFSLHTAGAAEAVTLVDKRKELIQSFPFPKAGESVNAGPIYECIGDYVVQQLKRA